MFNFIKNYIYRQIDAVNYVQALNIAAMKCNSESFSSIKCCNMGKDVVLCGGGPTLAKYKPIEGALHIALNRALLNEKVNYDWFIADDWDGVDFFKDKLKDYKCRKFFGHQISMRNDYSRQIPESFRIECNAARYYTDSFKVRNGYESRFVADIDKMAIGNMPNIALSAMQIALFTCPRKIYLVGCDASSGHFVQPENLSEARIAVHEKDLKMAVSSERVINKWKELKDFAQAFYPDTEIVSINPVGLKGIFKDIYQD